MSEKCLKQDTYLHLCLSLRNIIHWKSLNALDILKWLTFSGQFLSKSHFFILYIVGKGGWGWEGDGIFFHLSQRETFPMSTTQMEGIVSVLEKLDA